jgi:hypothetical protein
MTPGLVTLSYEKLQPSRTRPPSGLADPRPGQAPPATVSAPARKLCPGAAESTVVRRRPLCRLASSTLLLAALATVPGSGALTQGHESWGHLTPEEIRRYHKAQTLIDWTPEQIRTRPELRKLQLAESQGDLSLILQKTGETVAALFGNFPNTTSTEKVQAEVCSGGSGLCYTTARYSFRYLLVVRAGEGARFISEYRTDEKGKPVDFEHLEYMPMLTSGFVSTALHFHPRDQTFCRFRYFGRQKLRGRQAEVVGFAQMPGQDPPATEFAVGDRSAHLLVQGLAWIDARSHEILHIQTDLLAPRPDLGLEKATTRIDFSAIHLRDLPAALRLPVKVTVDLWWFHRHLRNIHEYSGFKLFRVESHISPVAEK